ncbi:helix-turn-helix transcriptional regulator [Ectopseudomonas alcaliphila]|uniref:helix-turn-helix transcriptional regulator n=1 Tax=Ectopseudomonas alcaliphila TaxID=101564 RepID=UPI0027846C44|nr:MULTISPECIES: helix-turn-helix transcriptional regulator [Pseudomonas]MDP9938555.1 transcriptional regulator with XRE-family HTH domain [Pseudomonas sp. 3400]MDR7010778.1 transcriptional regulator with XRE-family HTH domain [Pseudomonas alcaliphila]
MTPVRTLDRTRQDLSEFLLYHRRKLGPADVGLPATGRRRTPGLRREEVAALAGVGLTWYTWFEQGRDIGVSESFLLNVARALKLDDAECCHLFLLAHRRPPPAEAHQWPAVTPLIQQLMDDLVARPAYVINLRWDVIAWNGAADQLFGFAGRTLAERNFIRMVFTAPDLRKRLPEWREDAQRLLSHFRCDLAAAPRDDPAILALTEELQRLSADFRRWWETPGAGEYSRGVRTISGVNDPLRLEFQHEILTVDEHRHLRMVVYFPAGLPATGSAATDGLS